MVQSNFQHRRQFLPSEMARTLKILRNIYSCERERAGDAESPVPTQHTKDLLAEQTNISPRQVHRYLRLSELSPELLELVDANRLKMGAAVEISYLDMQAQGWVMDFYEDRSFLPNGAKAKKLRTAFESGERTEGLLERIMEEEAECSIGDCVYLHLISDSLMQNESRGLYHFLSHSTDYHSVEG